jgi:hypothetical protein
MRLKGGARSVVFCLRDEGNKYIGRSEVRRLLSSLGLKSSCHSKVHFSPSRPTYCMYKRGDGKSSVHNPVWKVAFVTAGPDLDTGRRSRGQEGKVKSGHKKSR